MKTYQLKLFNDKMYHYNSLFVETDSINKLREYIDTLTDEYGYKYTKDDFLDFNYTSRAGGIKIKEIIIIKY